MRVLLLFLVLGVSAIAAGPISADQPPKNGLIAFESTRDGRAGIWLMNPDGSEPRKLTGGGSGYGMDWSPDGRRLAVTKESAETASFDIFVVDLATGAEVNLTHHPAVDVAPAWSPDGSTIAFVSERHGGGTFELYLMDASGDNVRRLTYSGAGAMDPTWSPDSLQIAFQRSDPATHSFDIFVINADGTGERNISSSPWFEGAPAWSPDGALIAFTSVRGDALVLPGLYVMHPDGSDQRLLIDSPVEDPEWSPDGRFIAYSRGPTPRDSTDTDSLDIFVANADGSGERNISLHPAPDITPAWQPFPRMTPPRSGDGGLKPGGRQEPVPFLPAVVFALLLALRLSARTLREGKRILQ